MKDRNKTIEQPSYDLNYRGVYERGELKNATDIVPSQKDLLRDIKTSNENRFYLEKGEKIAYTGKTLGMSGCSGVQSTYKNLFLTSVLFAGFNYEVDIVPKLVVMTIVTALVDYILQPIVSLIVARTNTRIGRYRPYGFIFTIPYCIAGALMFYSPAGFDLNQKIIYITIVTACFNACNVFIGQSFNVQQVMSPNPKERGKWIGLSGIISTVGSVLPMIVFLLMSQFLPETEIYTKLAIVFMVFMLVTYFFYFGRSKERMVYNPQKVKTKTALLVPFKYKTFVLFQSTSIIRNLAAFTGITTPFLAGVAMGVEKAILFSLPTGAGTVFGLLLCNILLKKFKPLYMMRAIGLYSFVVATAATIIGPFGGVAFYILYFMYGITYGFFNVLPNIVAADVYDFLEWKTGQRLEASCGVLVNYLNKAVTILRDTLFVVMLAWAGYKSSAVGQSVFDANAANRELTSRILLFYAVGIPGFFFMVISIIYFFIDLEGKTKDKMLAELKVMREGYKKAEIKNIAK